MNIVVLLPWIALSSLLAPAVAVEPGPRCDANHTSLLLLVDLSHDINLTIARLKNIASYFVAKVKDGVIKTLDVCLVDPFQDKMLFNLTTVNSSQEITSVIDQIVKSNVSLDDYQVSKAFLRTPKYFNYYSFNNMVEQNQYVVVFLSQYKFRPNFNFLELHDRFHQYNDILMIVLFESHSNISTEKYSKYYQSDYGTEKQSYLIVDNDDDFTKYNPVSLYACRECPKGWIRYSQTVYNRLSCYFVDEMAQSMSWTQTKSLCESLKSNLPMFETEDELMLLKNYLRQRKVATTADLNVSLATSAVVYTGLMLKYYWPKKTSFIWMNSRPFNLVSNMAEIVDDSKNCLAFTLPRQKNTDKQDIGWALVNCDKPKSRLLVCELEVNLIYNRDEIGAQLEATSQITTRRKMVRQSVKHREYVTVFHFYNMYFGEIYAGTFRFDCQVNSNYFDYRKVCDGVRHCSNGRDEQYCNMLAMVERSSKFFCENPNGVNDYPSRVSVSLEASCDGIQDCPDRSDEKGCDGCLGRQCEDGTCLPRHWLSRDFAACNLFIGANSTAFLNVSYSCISQCYGLVQFSHEISFCNRTIKVEEYSEGELLYSTLTNKIQWAPKCLFLRGRDGRPTGCHDEYQLRDCTTVQCPEGFIKCINSYCVPVYNVRDGVFDCPFGEDEELVINTNDVNDIYQCNEPSYYTQRSIHVHEVHICDGVPQCPRSEDEVGCPMTCPTGFQCNGDSVGDINYTLVQEIKSLNIFDLKTKYLNISGIDLSKLNETFIFPNLLEVHASNCNLENLDKIFNKDFANSYIYTANFSHNRLRGLFGKGPLSTLENLQFLDLSHNENLTVVETAVIFSKRLRTLDLSFTGISIFKFNHQANYLLRSGNLYNTKFSPNGNLSKPKSLEFLNLEKVSLRAEDMTKILKSVSVSSALYVDSYKYCCPQISTGGTPRHACHAPPEAISSCEDLLGDSLKRSLLWLVAGVSLAGNIVVITYRLVYDRGVFEKGGGVFLTNLRVSDIFMGVSLLIMAFTDVHYRGEYVLHESVWRHSALCRAAGFLSTLSSETSTLFVFLITLDRYLVIKFPFCDHRFTKLDLFLSVLFSWILGFILALIPLMYPKWIIYSSNGMCFGLPLSMGPHPGWHYSFGVFICFNFIVFLCIACGQILIFRLILSGHSFQMTNAQSVARRVQNIKHTKQLSLVVLSNFLCWFPICVFGFLSITGYEFSPDTNAWLVIFVMPLNAAVNPMIFAIPIMYSKWQDFKKGETTRSRCLVNKSEPLEIKL